MSAGLDVPVTPAEAFRLILQKRLPQKPSLGREISSYEWFHHAWARSEHCTAEDKLAAEVALEILCLGVREYRIKLRGTLGDNPPNDIDRNEQLTGELHVFGQYLECGAARTYREVFCTMGDVVSLISPAAPIPAPRAKKKGRTPHPWGAIEDAVFTLMNRRGQFTPDQRDWNCRARLEEIICDDFIIGRSQLASRLPDMLDRWMKSGK